MTWYVYAHPRTCSAALHISSDLQESAPLFLLSNGHFQTAEDLGGLRVKSSQSFRHLSFVTRTVPTYFPRRSVKPKRQTFLIMQAKCGYLILGSDLVDFFMAAMISNRKP